MMNIFERFTSKLLDRIDLIIEYHCTDIQIHVKWSSKIKSIQWNLPYVDEECTLPKHTPLFYLCSSKTGSLNPSFYSYWFQLDQSFSRRLFSTITLDDEHLILLISMPDGRIIALPEAAKDHHPIIWYTSFSSHPVLILGFDYDLNNNLLDAVLSSTSTKTFPNRICNHLILCDYQGCLILLNSSQLRRILIDTCIRSACIHSHQLIYLTKNEIRSIAITNLFKSSNEDLINQTKILRFGHFDKLIVDGQEIILYYQNGTFERLNHLLPPPSAFNHPLRTHSLSNQSKQLACLTSTITNLQSQACVLQRILTKIEFFYQLNLQICLKSIDQQWKLIFTEQQLRIFQPQDFLLILICQLSSKEIRIYQLNSNNNWIFQLKDLMYLTGLCQPILLLRCQNQLYCRIGVQKILLPLQEHVQEEKISLENYFPEKYRSVKKNSLSIEQYHLVCTLRNDAAMQFKKLNWNFVRRIAQVNIECKQQEIKVDTDAGLVDAWTIQIILSSSCLRRLIVAYSVLTELFYGNQTLDEKSFIKQTDMVKLTELIQDTQTKLSNLSDDIFLHLLQIRIYLSMFRLGSNYTVQVY